MFYSNNDARKNALHLFITSYLEPSYVDDFRVGLDGKLERAVRRRGEATSRVGHQDASAGFQAGDGLSCASKQDQLGRRARTPRSSTTAPARRARSSACPRDPKQAVCLDRERLQAN